MLEKATLPAATAIVLIGAFALANLAETLDMASTVQMAGFTLVGLVPRVERFLQRQLARRGLSDPPGLLVPFGSFGTTPGRMFVYGTLFIVAVIELVGFLAGVAAGAVTAGADVSPEALQALVGVLSLVVLPVAIMAVGVWVGLRVVHHALVTIIACSLASRYLLALIDVVLMSAEEFEGMYRVSRADGVITVLTYGSLIGLVLALTLGLLGLWVGRTQRAPQYVASLLRQVPAPARSALVDVVHLEAVRRRDLASSMRAGARVESTPLVSTSPVATTNDGGTGQHWAPS